MNLKIDTEVEEHPAGGDITIRKMTLGMSRFIHVAPLFDQDENSEDITATFKVALSALDKGEAIYILELLIESLEEMQEQEARA